MNATTAKRATRKVIKKPASKADVELASLPLWLRKVELLARPLRGKLTKAINQK